ncbi:MAG: hypothetical protein PHW29_05790 [Flavobacterium sp.]|nr:hypothetical protein [Flavobacterium sp.]
MQNQSKNAVATKNSAKERTIQLEIRNKELEQIVLQRENELNSAKDKYTYIKSRYDDVRKIVDLRADFDEWLLGKSDEVRKGITEIQEGNIAGAILTQLQFN